MKTRMLLILSLMLAWGAPARAAQEPLYSGKFRPQFHFSARSNWLNDPNGLVFYKGEYHLFFQHNPGGINWGDMHWGHAVSPDLVHWQELPIALAPDENGTNFSGSAVVDWNNTAGLQSGEEKTLIALYTAAPDEKNGKGKKFSQCLVYSNDRGRTWKKYDKNPVIPNIIGSNRDPRVFWHEPSKKWVVALYKDRSDFAFFGSPDLKQWTHLSDLTVPGSSECPEFFQLPLTDGQGEPRWVFYAGNGNYELGRFDGTRFFPATPPLKQDWGKNFYASQTYSDIPAADGRRIQIGWMRDGKYPGMAFNQQMSFPCELTLRQVPGEGVRLCRLPVREIERLRAGEHSWNDLALTPGASPIGNAGGALLDVRAEFEVGQAREVGLIVCGEKIAYAAQEGRLSCLGTTAPLKAEGGRVRIQVLADRASLEVFGGRGQAALSNCFLPRDGARGVEVYATGGAARLVSLKVYDLKSAWTENAGGAGIVK